MSHVPLLDRLGRLEERLARIEQRLGLDQLPTPAQATQRIPAPAAWPPEPSVALPPPLPVRQPPAPLPVLAHAEPPILAYAPKPPPAPPAAQGRLEQTIGLKWAGWVGAVVLVIGAGLGIHYAYQNHWFELISPAGRLALMSLAGLALLGAGEIVLRRVSAAAAAALFGAGVAILFVVSHAGHAYFRLYQAQTAFVFMALTAVIGAAVAVRGQMVSIAILALIGGNLAPLVIQGDNSLLVPFLAYLLMLQIVAVGLAWWGEHGKWWVLRVLSFLGTALWVLSVVAGPDQRHDPSLAPLWFGIVYWAVYQAELTASGSRAGRESPQGGGIAFSAYATAALTALMLYVLREQTPALRGLVTLAMAAACGVMGPLLARGRPVLRMLGGGLAAQAVVLVVLAVPVALDGARVSVAWAGLAVVFALAGARLNLPMLRAAAMLIWVLAAGSLVRWAHAGDAEDDWVLLQWTVLEPYAVLGWGLTVVGMIVASLVHSGHGRGEADDEFSPVSLVLAGMASLLFALTSIQGLDATPATIALVVYAWVMALIRGIDRHLRLPAHAAAALALALVKWAAVDALGDRFAADWVATAQRPLCNPVMASGMLIAVSLAGIFWLRRRDWLELLGMGEKPEAARISVLALAGLIIALLAFALSLEIDRVVEQSLAAGQISTWPPMQLKLLGWTMLWTLSTITFAGIARVVCGSIQAAAGPLRLAAMALVLIGLKMLLIDSLSWRLAQQPAWVPVLGNMQALCGLIVIAALLGMAWLVRAAGALAASRLPAAVALVVFMCAASLEIDRLFEHAAPGWIADPPLAKQVALSVFWGLLAVGCVVAGFRLRLSGLRYAGLGLFALTLLKVVLVDMSDAEAGYRILSFIALGLLLLGTSVLYGKLSPRLLGSDQAAGRGG
jgi:uncharacterized membrane protein